MNNLRGLTILCRFYQALIAIYTRVRIEIQRVE